VLASLILAGFALVQAPAPDTALVLRTLRFYRADPGRSPGHTQVTAFIRIPANFPTAGKSGELSLTLALRVADAAGQTLYQQSWQKRSAVPSPRGEADRLDLFRFTLPAGTYQLEANVTDSVSGRRLTASAGIEAFGTPPPASDLLVSPWLRPVAAADTIPLPGEFRRGSLILAIAPDVVVGGPGSSVAYLFETYSGSALDGTIVLTVLDSTGHVVKRTPPAPVRVSAGIGLLSGQLEVDDLPSGEYRLGAAVGFGGRTIEREARFRMDPVAASAPAALSDEAFFATLHGAELDLAFAPISAIAAANELSAWSPAGDDQAKRAFLTAFWKRRDPTPNTPGNERRAQFYDAVTYANAFYGEPKRRLTGWQTDRGRVFLREGLPTQVLRRQQRGTVPAYEVWRFFEKGGRYYIFADRPNLGTYYLIRSNDPREQRERRWAEILTPTGTREVVAFLGREVLNP